MLQLYELAYFIIKAALVYEESPILGSASPFFVKQDFQISSPGQYLMFNMTIATLIPELIYIFLVTFNLVIDGKAHCNAISY